MSKLTAEELIALVKRVFSPTSEDKKMALLVDMPDQVVPDQEKWRARRELAADWYATLAPEIKATGLEQLDLFLYRNPRANNADLPAQATLHQTGPLPATADDLRGEEIPFADIFKDHSILIAPTQFSATAPLKMAARKYGFRAATMPGFSGSMIPALRLDYTLIGARVDKLREVLDQATACELTFAAADREHKLTLDLRYRPGHASGGSFPRGGVAGNLPSGESYIVPYEGEIEGDPSRSCGEIPVQFDDEIVVYRIAENRAVEVLSTGPAATREKEHLAAEPAYGNLAELGLGVLGDFGLEPTGEILLDEKLGLHVAFGRSEHFGGQVGPNDFSGPDKVVHIDRVYIPKIQKDITVKEAWLTLEGQERIMLMRDGAYSLKLD